MKQCQDNFQFKHERLQCEFEHSHKGPHYNAKYGCWPNPQPKTMTDIVNRGTMLLIGLGLAAGALLAIIWWLVERHP